MPTALVTALLYLAVIDHQVIFVNQVKFYSTLKAKYSIMNIGDQVSDNLMLTMDSHR